jgi:hypothetical protein
MRNKGKREVSSTDLLIPDYALNKTSVFFTQQIGLAKGRRTKPNPLRTRITIASQPLDDDDLRRLIVQARILVDPAEKTKSQLKINTRIKGLISCLDQTHNFPRNSCFGMQ